jgi:hypothetical protein
LPDSDPNPSQRFKPKWSSLCPRGPQDTDMNAVRSRHDLHPNSNPKEGEFFNHDKNDLTERREEERV